MSDDNAQYQGRIQVLGIAFMIIFVTIISRLWLLQVIRGPENYAIASSNSQRRIPLPAPRGLIQDCHGRTLVTSRLSYILQVVPEDLTEESKTRLLRFIPLTRKQLEERIAENLVKSDPRYPISILTDLDPVTILKIEEDKQNLVGVRIHEVYVRDYPNKEYGAHLFGYLGKISPKEWEEKKALHYRPDDVVGMIGLEKTYEPELKGTDGVIIYEMDVHNRPLSQLEEIEPLAGSSLKLTIDWDIHMAAEKAMREHLQYLRSRGTPTARAGAVIALDPKTGGILAMVSYPAFDPNMFVGRTPPDWYSQMSRNPLHPFMNRTIAAYPPGSVFKPVTALAALEEGLVNLSDRFNCMGYDPLYGAKKKCWIASQGKTHGREDLIGGIKNSCNIVFYELGRRLEIDRLAKYARILGFSQKTGLNFYPAEKSGLVPDLAYRKQIYEKRPEMAVWYPIETLDVSIGQGELLVTPLQVAQLYMAIANRGAIFRPHLVTAMQDYYGQSYNIYRPELINRINFRKKHWEIVEEGLKAVAGVGGTAGWAFNGAPYEVAGKTGTAENSFGEDHAWFAGYAPVGNPKIVVVVLVENGGSGSAGAAPIARRIMDAYLVPKVTPVPVPEQTKTQPSASTAATQPPAGNTAPGPTVPPAEEIPVEQ